MIAQLTEIAIFEGTMTVIASVIFFIGFVTTHFLYLKNRTITTVMLILLMASGFLYTFTNIFDKFEVWQKADEFGDPFIVAFATILVVMGLVVILEEKLLTSEKNLRKQFSRVNFFRDLFSHDMSNVVQNIKSSLTLYYMKSKAPENLKETEELLEIINQQSLRGENLISNVRRISQMEDYESNLTSVEVFNVLNDTIKHIKKSFHKNINIQLDFLDNNIKIFANEFLTDLFENILINAIMHNTNPNVEIQIKTFTEKKNN